jgi:undecaprenyl-diphosphatase
VLSYLQAIVIGALQGVTELFPISSLGHSVLVPAWIGGSWEDLVTQSSSANSESSPYLAFIVALHVATAIALLIYFREDWVRIISGFLRCLGPSVRARRVVARDGDERLAWLIVIATIPVGVTGLLLEHTFRTLFAKPFAAALFLTVNGLILLAGEWLRRTAPADDVEGEHASVGAGSGGAPAMGSAGDPRRASPEPGARWRPRSRLASLRYGEAFAIGMFQTLALLAGISRSGVAMVGGLIRGLSHEDAAHFSFLLATPVIFAAGVLKLPTLFGPAGDGIHGQVIAGSIVAGCAAYLSVRFLTRYFETRTLLPFAIYSLAAGIISMIRFA